MEAVCMIASGYIALIELPFCRCFRSVLGFIIEYMLHHGPPRHLWGVTLPGSMGYTRRKRTRAVLPDHLKTCQGGEPVFCKLE